MLSYTNKEVKYMVNGTLARWLDNRGFGCMPVTAVNVVGDIKTLNTEFEDLPSLPIDECKI
jgi:hypothetical protein